METTQVIEGIVAIRKSIHEEHLWNNPVALSDKMTKLAVYNAYLADRIAPLHAKSTGTELAAFKAARDMETGVTEAERLARGESVTAREEYENIKNIYQATSNLISVLQSRLRVIESEMKRGGTQT